MGDFLDDLRFGVRLLTSRPAFAAATTLLLALGIGASVTLFSVLDAVLLRPLPFSDPAALVALWERPPRTAQWTRQTVPFPLFLEWQGEASSFAALGGLAGRDFTLTTEEGPERLRGDAVTPELFTLLGVRMAQGRALDARDETGPPVVVLSHRLWQQRFGRDPAAVGRSIALDGMAHTIVGVLGPDAIVPVLDQQPALWTVLTSRDPELRQTGGRVKVVGRLRPGVESQAAERELTTIQRAYQERQLPDQRAEGVLLQSLPADRAHAIGPTLNILAAAVGTLLLIACGNVAGLLLGRSLERTGEMAVRASLGASRGRLVWQLITEAIIVWTCGGALGIVSSVAGVRWFVLMQPFRAEELPSPDAIAVDTRAVLFACGLTLVTALVFGVLAALEGSRVDLVDALKQSGRGTSSARKTTRRWRSALVAGEVALSVTLLAGAGLLIASFAALSAQPLGFRPDGLQTFKLALTTPAHADHEARLQFHAELLERLRALPGVEAVSTTSARPLGGIVAAPFSIEGQPPVSGADSVWSGQQAVDPEYFQVAGIPIIRGRPFDARDRERSEPVVVINQTLARKFFASEDPVGKRIRHGSPDQPWMRIVGIAGDVKHAGLEWEVLPETFVPYRQLSGAYAALLGTNLFVMLRARDGGVSSQPALHAAVWSLDRGLPLTDVATGSGIVAESAARSRFRTAVMTTLAVAALVLAVAGLYGVQSQAVLRRRQELAIRLALGAAPRDILALVIGGGMRLAIIGTAVGVVGALGAAGLLESLLFGVSAREPAIILGVAAVVLLVAAAANLLPAQRAARADPLIAIRSE